MEVYPEGNINTDSSAGPASEILTVNFCWNYVLSHLFQIPVERLIYDFLSVVGAVDNLYFESGQKHRVSLPEMYAMVQQQQAQHHMQYQQRLTQRTLSQQPMLQQLPMYDPDLVRAMSQAC